MPWLVGSIMSGLAWLFKSQLGLFIMTAMAWLGINFGTVKLVIEPAVELLQGYAQSMGGGSGDLGATAIQWLGVLQFDKALTMIISAVAMKHGIMAGRLYLFKRGFGAKP